MRKKRHQKIITGLRYDDNDSSYSTTSNGNSACGTNSNIGSSHGIFSDPGTGLWSFKSSISTLGDDRYNSCHTTPSSDSGSTTGRKMVTKAVEPDNTTDYKDLDSTILAELKYTLVGLQDLAWKVNDVNEKLENIYVELKRRYHGAQGH